MRNIKSWSFVFFVTLAGARAQDTGPLQLEGFPDDMQARMEFRDRSLRNLPASVGGRTREFVIRNLNRWEPGQTLRVAFFGGDTLLHRDIATAAATWTQWGNVKLDFGVDQQGTYRTWSPSDTMYAAEVRISFNQAGYWSAVGTDSVNPTITRPGEASMNFGGFHLRRPGDWKATVLHEFGHAFGFEHEHQHPTQGCDHDFRWDDDLGYVGTQDQFHQYIKDLAGHRPGVYTVLGGEPNIWPKSKVDFNLRQLNEDSHAFILGDFDNTSIMKYYFEAWMFVNGTNSHCYSGQNLILSPQDKLGIARAYPTSAQDITNLLGERAAFFSAVIGTDAVGETERNFYQLRKSSIH